MNTGIETWKFLDSYITFNAVELTS